MSSLNDDFVDLLDALDESAVEYVIVGAHAMAAHGVPRATGDLDVFIRAAPENTERVLDALLRFGAPIDAHGITSADFSKPGDVFYEGRDVPILGLAELVRKKSSTGRAKDAVDLELLREAGLPVDPPRR